jgi:succinate dehydrogenase / fumarate reductase, cytochrome b subunit
MENTVNTSSRPMHLDLTRMKFPPMAIVSVMHRISGVLLFLLLPFMLYLLHTSLQSQDSFEQLHHFMALPSVSFFLWVLVCAVSFHFLAGVRHMLMDCGLGESLQAGRVTAYLIIVLEVIVMIFSGVWLW